MKLCRKVFEETDLMNVYTSLSPNRRHLVTPIELTDEMYIEKWLKSGEKETNTYPIELELYTDRGERVRSKSEKIIAYGKAGG